MRCVVSGPRDCENAFFPDLKSAVLIHMVGITRSRILQVHGRALRQLELQPQATEPPPTPAHRGGRRVRATMHSFVTRSC